MIRKLSRWIFVVICICMIHIVAFYLGGYNHSKKRVKSDVSKGSSYDLRVIVMVFNRPRSLLRILNTINEAEYDGDSVKLEVRIDRNSKDYVHETTERVARSFVFKHGDYEVIINTHHIGITGQWLRSWVPEPNSTEIAVLLEDDMTLSKHYYRYLKIVHKKYDHRPDINGYTLQGHTKTHNHSNRGTLEGPKGTIVFLYPVLGTWGFSPNNRNWKDFLDWYDSQENNRKRKFRIRGNIAATWHRKLRKHGLGDTMWEIWHIYYAYKNKELTLYSNFMPGHYGLSANYAERGLHSRGIGKPSNPLLQEWTIDENDLPAEPAIVDLNARVITPERK